MERTYLIAPLVIVATIVEVLMVLIWMLPMVRIIMMLMMIHARRCSAASSSADAGVDASSTTSGVDAALRGQFLGGLKRSSAEIRLTGDVTTSGTTIPDASRALDFHQRLVLMEERIRFQTLKTELLSLAFSL